MRHDASTESLNPKLQRALNCLDIHLEDELTRYRRQRAGQTISSVVATPKRKQATKALNFLSPVAAASPQATLPPQLAGLSPSPKGIYQDQGLEEDSSQLALLPSRSPAGHSVENGALHSSDGSPWDEDELCLDDRTNVDETDTPPDDYLESSEELLRSLSHEEAQVEVERSFLESLVTPLGVGSMLMLLLSSAMFGYVIMNPASLRNIGSIFARRETASIASSRTTAAAANSEFSNSVPLDSQEFVDLGLDNLATLKSAPRGNFPIASQPSQTVASGNSFASRTITPPSAPNFSGGSSASSNNAPSGSPSSALRNEGTPSNTYSRSSSYSGSVSSSRSAPSSSYSSSSSSGGSGYSKQVRNPERVYSSYSPSASSNYQPAPPAPSRSYRLPAPLKTYSPPIVARSYSRSVEVAPSSATRTASGGYSYKVEVPFTGDQSLDAARRVAPDAYLRSDGKIQMGAARNQAEAQQKVQALQNHGIAADVSRR
jgi:hypothetical protein